MSRLDEIRDVIRDGMLLEHEEARYLLALTDKLLAALEIGVRDFGGYTERGGTSDKMRAAGDAMRAAILEARK